MNDEDPRPGVVIAVSPEPEGLEQGELLITAGISRIEDGMQVRLLGTDEGETAP